MANCTNTKLLRKVNPRKENPVLLFNDCAGLKEDCTKAGYKPASRITRTVIVAISPMIDGCPNCDALILISSHFEMSGKNKALAAKLNIRETNTRKLVSPRNCRISWVLIAPSTFRIPTSLARLIAWAVDRLMKLMEAI